jgi:6-phosphogluconolactonase
MSAPGLRVVVEPSPEALAAAAASRTVEVLAAAQRERGRAALVVTGGSILERTLGQLAGAAQGSSLDWSRVDVWWGDERYVGAESDERNDAAALRAGLDALGLHRDRVHRAPAAQAGVEVEDAAAEYAARLAAAAREDPGADPDLPRLDVALLGVGPDGHCASLFPGHPALEERTAAVVGVRDSPKPPPLRLSFGYRALGAIDRVWFVVASADKADAVARAVGGDDVRSTPSAAPRGRTETLWLLDEAAAGRLDER